MARALWLSWAGGAGAGGAGLALVHDAGVCARCDGVLDDAHAAVDGCLRIAEQHTG